MGVLLVRTLSVVIPALNEADNICAVVQSVPRDALATAGWATEVLVVDNASTDGTGDLAAAAGARVVLQPERGYGNAYKAGFSAARGEVIVTGDADRTYPLDQIPALLNEFERSGADFLTTNRLLATNRGAMKPSHMVGNRVLSGMSRLLFRNGFVDSQSGMWMFRNHVWRSLDVRSDGMAFSQEIKNEATLRRFRCTEVPIEYRPRGGEVKLNAARDGVRNLSQLFAHRFRRQGQPTHAFGSGAALAPPLSAIVPQRMELSDYLRSWHELAGTESPGSLSHTSTGGLPLP
jgi:glycosyltransferase involved in cell wall biosynthesis